MRTGGGCELSAGQTSNERETMKTNAAVLVLLLMLCACVAWAHPCPPCKGNQVRRNRVHHVPARPCPPCVPDTCKTVVVQVVQPAPAPAPIAPVTTAASSSSASFLEEVARSVEFRAAWDWRHGIDYSNRLVIDCRRPPERPRPTTKDPFALGIGFRPQIAPHVDGFLTFDREVWDGGFVEESRWVLTLGAAWTPLRKR